MYLRYLATHKIIHLFTLQPAIAPESVTVIQMNFITELIKNVLFKGVNVILSFAITIILVRLLGTEGNGIYSLLIANVTIISLVISFSLNSGLSYFIAKAQFPIVAIFNTLIIITVFQIVTVVVLEQIFIALFGVSFFLDTSFPGLTVWGSLYVLAVLLNGYFSAMFSGKKWFDHINIITVFINIFSLILFGVLYFKNPTITFDHTIWILKIFIGISLAQALLSTCIFLIKIKYRPSSQLLSLGQTKQIIAYAGIAFFSNLFQFMAYRMDYWFIDFYWNKEELGLYALASKLGQVMWLLPMTIAAVIVPFTVTDTHQAEGKIKSLIRILLNGYILLAILLVFISPVLIPWIFGENFIGSVQPFLILLPGIVFFLMTTILAAYFAGIRRLDINLTISIACFVIIMVGDFLLVPSLGKVGAGIASSIGYSISGFASLYYFSKMTQNNMLDLLLFKKSDFSSMKEFIAQKMNR